MTIFKSANSNYSGVKCYENEGLLKKLQNTFKGYIEIPLNLSDFILHNQLDMILNNTIFDPLTFDLYNQEKIFLNELEDLKDDYLEDINEFIETANINLEDVIGLTPNEILEAFDNELDMIAADNVAMIEIYQYFIIPEYDVDRYWNKYTDYPIFYNSELEIYLLGITHFGMSWKYFSTNFKIRHYL